MDANKNLSEAISILDQAKKLYSDGNRDQAKQLCLEAINLHPQFVSAHYLLGTIELECHRYLEAANAFWIAWLHGSLQIVEPALMAGRCLSAAQFYMEACAVFESIPIDRIDGLSKTHYAHALDREGRTTEAEKIITTFSIPDNAFYCHAKALILQNLGKHSEAIPIFEKLLPQDETGVIYDGLNGCYAAIGEFEKLDALLKEASQRVPNGAFYRNMRIAYKLVSGEVPLDSHYEQDDRYGYLIDTAKYLARSTNNSIFITGGVFQTFDRIACEVSAEGAICEFGVRHGHSITYISKLFPDREIFGFDSFEGIPESWGDEPVGSYTTGGRIPKVPNNVRLFAGWFRDTLPKFRKSQTRPLSLLNIDCDIYSSTKEIFDLLGDLIRPGTVIVFDEYIGSPRWRDDEYRAFMEWVSREEVTYRYLAASFVTKQVALVILTRRTK